MKEWSKISLILAFLCGFSAYNLRFWLWEESFYHLIAVEFVLLYFIIWNEAAKGLFKSVALLFMVTCINSLIDEIFFEPQAIELNEYIGFGVIIVITYVHEKFFGFLKRCRN